MRCETCDKGSVQFLSGNMQTGRWALQCDKCGDNEYWIPIADFNVMYDKWMDHLRAKRWFNEDELEKTMERYITI